jgi:hypothetical protein
VVSASPLIAQQHLQGAVPGGHPFLAISSRRRAPKKDKAELVIFITPKVLAVANVDTSQYR